MLRDPDFRRNLLVSIITSVLVLLFIEPILKWSGNAVMWLGANIYDGITNSIYKSAALGFRELSSFTTLLIMVAILSGVFAAFTMVMVAPQRHRAVLVENKRNYLKIFFIITTVTFLLNSFLIIAKDFEAIQLNTSFNQRLAVLAPKVSELQIKELRASWALMEKRADYVALTAEMNRLASQFNIKLPAPLPGAQ